MRQLTHFTSRPADRRFTHAPTAGRWSFKPQPPPIPSLSAEERLAIVLRARDGEAEAQADLVRRYRHRVIGCVRAVVGPHHSNEDIGQAVLVRMLRALSTLRDPRLFEPWLFTLARNAAKDSLRRARLRSDHLLGEKDWEQIPDDNDHFRRQQLVEDVHLAIQQLCPRDQVLISLVVEGHSQQHIAQQQRTTCGAIKARLSRLRLVLREELREHAWRDAVKSAAP